MSAATVYSVLSLGFDAAEQRLLRTLFALSQQGTRAWRYQDAEEAATAQSAVIVVNADDDAAFSQYWLHYAQRKDAIVVLAAREQTEPTPHTCIRRPLRASTLLAALDQAVAERTLAQPARQTQAERGTLARRTLYRQLTTMTFGNGFHKA